MKSLLSVLSSVSGFVLMQDKFLTQHQNEMNTLNTALYTIYNSAFDMYKWSKCKDLFSHKLINRSVRV